MTDPNKPSHSLASFLRNAPAVSPLATPQVVAPAPAAAPPVEATAAAATPGQTPADDTLKMQDGVVVHTAIPAADVPTAPVPQDLVHDASIATADLPPAADPDMPQPATPATAQATSTPPPAAAATPTVAPSFTRNERVAARRGPTPRWKWPAVIALALLLPLQILLADRARLAMDPTWRPLLTTLCGTLRCTLPPWHQPDAFTMLDREVRPAPDAPGVLQIQASFRNDARWAQAWPRLELSLSDADGRVIGSRVFEPQDYLGAGALVGDTLAPGQSTRIAFRVREPAAGTAAFNFEFR